MPALNIYLRPVAGDCNLACGYCGYEETGALGPVPGGVMSLETLEAVVRRAMEEAEGQCGFVFQGREPMLAGLDFYTALLGLERKYNQKHLRVNHVLMTNGTLMTPKWGQFLTKNRFRVVVSLDGHKGLHNRYRVDRQRGRGTFAKAATTVQVLQNQGGDVQISAVVTPGTLADVKKAYGLLRGYGAEVLFAPCAAGHSSPGGERLDLTPEEYGGFLTELFDLWYRDKLRSRAANIQYFTQLLMMLQGGPPQTCALYGQCIANYAVAADGSVYPCQYYCQPGWLLGNAGQDSFRDLADRQQALGFIQGSIGQDQACGRCQYMAFCRGGCRKDRLQNPDGTLGLSRYCQSYRIFFDHALPRLAYLAGVQNPLEAGAAEAGGPA